MPSEDHWQANTSSFKVVSGWIKVVAWQKHSHNLIAGCSTEDPDKLPALQVQAQNLRCDIKSHVIKVFP